MDTYKEKYESLVAKLREARNDESINDDRFGVVLDGIIPELAESEDERIINCIQLSLTDVSEQRFKDFNTTLKDCLTWLKKQKEQTFTHHEVDESLEEAITHQMEDDGDIDDFVRKGLDDVVLKYAELGAKWQKEQKPVDPSDDELQRHQDELYNFKVFAAKQAKEHHISFVHDFEWNNFCAEILSYFNEQQQPAEWSEEDKQMLLSIINAFRNGTVSTIGQEQWLKALPERFSLQPKREWSKEDDYRIRWIISLLTTMQEKGIDDRFGDSVPDDIPAMISWLKSLRPQPHWKPSEEQMKALQKFFIEGVKALTQTDCNAINSIYLELKKLM